MMSFRERNLLWSSNLWYLGEGMLGPLFAVFAEKVGGNILDITWAWATFLGVTGITTIVIGKLSDRFARRGGKEKLMVFGYALNALFTFGYLLVSSPLDLFLVQAGLGVALAFAAPTWAALYDEASDSQHDGLEWGLASGMGRLALAAGIIVGGYIVTTYSFSVLFFLMGSVQVVATLYQARILARPKKSS